MRRSPYVFAYDALKPGKSLPKDYFDRFLENYIEGTQFNNFAPEDQAVPFQFRFEVTLSYKDRTRTFAYRRDYTIAGECKATYIKNEDDKLDIRITDFRLWEASPKNVPAT